MREQSGNSWRRWRTPAIGIVAAALMSLVATTAQAVPSAPASTERAAQAASAKVLKNEHGKLRSRVVGSFGNGGTVDATFVPRRFKTVGDQLVAVGRLQGELVRANGKVVGDFSERVKMPVATADGVPVTGAARQGRAATCEILSLVLAPLDLDLLGLQVHLDRVVLTIVAQSGAGNLLGNLLCAVAGLLDNTGVLSEIAAILDAILALLRL